MGFDPSLDRVRPSPGRRSRSSRRPPPKVAHRRFRLGWGPCGGVGVPGSECLHGCISISRGAKGGAPGVEVQVEWVGVPGCEPGQGYRRISRRPKGAPGVEVQLSGDGFLKGHLEGLALDVLWGEAGHHRRRLDHRHLEVCERSGEDGATQRVKGQWTRTQHHSMRKVGPGRDDAHNTVKGHAETDACMSNKTEREKGSPLPLCLPHTVPAPLLSSSLSPQLLSLSLPHTVPAPLLPYRRAFHAPL